MHAYKYKFCQRGRTCSGEVWFYNLWYSCTQVSLLGSPALQSETYSLKDHSLGGSSTLHGAGLSEGRLLMGEVSIYNTVTYSQSIKTPNFFSNIFLSISDILSLIDDHNKNFNVEKLMNKKSIFLSLLPKKWFKEKKYLWIPSFIIFHIHISLYLWDIIQYVLKIKLFMFILYMYIHVPTSLNFNTEWSALCISFFFSVWQHFW